MYTHIHINVCVYVRVCVCEIFKGIYKSDITGSYVNVGSPSVCGCFYWNMNKAVSANDFAE